MDAAAVQLSLPLQLSQLTGSLVKLQTYTIVILIDYTDSDLPGPAEGRQLNQPTTRPCS